jgi:hypothetical protein
MAEDAGLAVGESNVTDFSPPTDPAMKMGLAPITTIGACHENKTGPDRQKCELASRLQWK